MPKKDAYEYGCLMIDTSIAKWITHLHKVIRREDLASNIDFTPIEDTPHVTILYGLDKSVTYDDIRPNLIPLKLFNDIKISGISMFDNPQYDVLYLKVRSDQLHRANMFFRKHYKCSPQYPLYTPHMTLAYLKKGAGQRYLNRLLVAPRTIKPVCYRFTDTQGKSYTSNGNSKRLAYEIT